jgi:hypothetical protein
MASVIGKEIYARNVEGAVSSMKAAVERFFRQPFSRAKSLVPPLIVAIVVYSNPAIGQDINNTPLGDLSMPAVKSEVRNEPSRICAVQFGAFVEDLDKLLGSDPEDGRLVSALLKKYFSVERCNIEEVIRTSRQSRFFSHVSEERTYFVVAFDSKGLSSRPGFYVQVSLLKANGNSQLPFAIVNQ